LTGPTPDLNRLWDGGFSKLGAALCASPGDSDFDLDCGSTCPPGEFERSHPQDRLSGIGSFCDFRTRDRFNPVENVFISPTVPSPNPDFVPGTYTIRVIGFDVQGNAEPPTVAYPNLDDADGQPGYDVIDDRHQGYALIASGKVATRKGTVHFSKSHYRCGETQARVFVNDCDGVQAPVLEVVIRTPAGDQDRLPLLSAGPGEPGFVQATPPFTIVDASAGIPVGDDGTVVTTDDSDIVVLYADPSPAHEARATARVTCRDLTLLGATLSGDCNGNGALNREEAGLLAIQLQDTGGADVASLSGQLFPFDEDVLVLSPNPVPFQQQPVTSLWAGTFVVQLDDDHECDPGENLRFRLELAGAGGFEDRAYFEVPQDCSDADRPGEVPNGEGGTQPLLATKFPVLNPTDVVLTWAPPVTGPPPAAYDVWKGDLDVLHAGTYDHVIPAPRIPGDPPYCDVPTTVFRAVGDGMAMGPGPGTNFYYLVTAKLDCADQAVQCAIDGPFGYADRDRDFMHDEDERRPGGTIQDVRCIDLPGICP
jgi:hypothetical protein